MHVYILAQVPKHTTFVYMPARVINLQYVDVNVMGLQSALTVRTVSADFTIYILGRPVQA